MPEADAAVRATINAEARERGWPALHAELARIDPDAATRIHATDAQRIQRALEVFRLSGRPISQWQRDPPPGPRPPCRVLKLVVAPADRGVLHARIEARFDAMLAAGFLDRSEEHTSELQSLMRISYAVFCLKKKNNKK